MCVNNADHHGHLSFYKEKGVHVLKRWLKTLPRSTYGQEVQLEFQNFTFYKNMNMFIVSNRDAIHFSNFDIAFCKCL